MVEKTHVEGLEELRRALLELPKVAQGRALRTALRAGGREIEKEARARAPKGTTGRLARNIRTKTVRHPRGRTLAGRLVVATGDTGAHVTVGVRTRGKRDDPRNAFYWRFVEFGTSKMSARPFLRPAFDTKKKSVVDVVAQRLMKRIHAEARKLAKSPRP